jgi:HlyD family secretion protein
MRTSITISFLFALILVIQACSSGDNNNLNSNDRVIPSVEAVQAQFGSLPLEQRLSGIVRAGNQVAIYPRINAPIVEVYVQNGDYVQQGDPLVRLENYEYSERLEQARANLRINEAQMRQAEASLNEARNELRRQQTLAERDLISEVELERAELQVQSAEATLELTQAQVDQARSTMGERQDELNRTIIRSPISGIVGTRNAEIGMQANNNTLLFTVGDVDNTKVIVSLTETMVRNISIGQTAVIFSETIEDTLLYGEVARISPFLSQGSFSTQGEIEIPNESGLLLPGMFVTVDILYGESEQATIVPISAIYQHPRTGEQGIYVAPNFGTEMEPITDVDSDNPPPLSDPTELEFRRVQIVAKGRETVGVVGVNSGDWIVSVGQGLLVGSDDNRVRIRAATWDRIITMQRTQPQDLLERIMIQDYAGTVQ